MARRDTEILQHFQQIELEDPVDKVIQQIQTMLHSGVLKPGDRLPSEKRIEEATGISRGTINRAIRRLESFGILRTVPQSGSYVAAIGLDALEGLISNIIRLESRDLEALNDIRFVLEAYAAELAAQRASDEELRELEEVHHTIKDRISTGTVSFDEDQVLHLKIAELSHNPALKAFLTLLTSEAIGLFHELEKEIGSEKVAGRLREAIKEHELIVRALKRRDAAGARRALEEHYEKARRFRDQVGRSGTAQFRAPHGEQIESEQVENRTG